MRYKRNGDKSPEIRSETEESCHRS
uniref:Uncharacterized protein n=1 Tax=Nelumbo nucifera TaxID=4432 RepID=A0A822ZK40_NELNU|nr:TPA_asm: hypothetical protein HUJ06_003742 [Nelumbo nucifera]